MVYSYFPGCTLKTKAKDLDAYARRSAEALGVTLEELPEWQCCGAVYPIAQDEIATRLSSVRALNSAKELGRPLLTLCSACHHVIKRVNEDMRANEDIRGKANRYLELAEPYAGETRVVHYLEMLRDDVGFVELKKKVVNPLKGRKIAAYYGCLLLRPNDVMQFDNPENPTILEDFIRAIGAEPGGFRAAQRVLRRVCGAGRQIRARKARRPHPGFHAGSGRGQRDHRVPAVPVQPVHQPQGRPSAGVLFHRAAGGSARREGGELSMAVNPMELRDTVLRITGVNPRKCMKCGKCSGTCPAYDQMEYHPHQFVAMVEKGDIERLMASPSVFMCLSCFACVERCPRGVEPAKLIEGIRLAMIRQKDANHMTMNDIPALLDSEMPQQAITSALRKYAK